MGKTLVTGATGFLGSHLVDALARRGDDLRLTVRAGAEDVPADHETVVCDVLDRRGVRRCMRGVDRVFHAAGMVSLRAPARELERINGEGARIVLEEALRAGVQRVVHTSSVAAIGPAPWGRTADERQTFPAAARALPYVASKRLGEEHALRLLLEGLPVVIVNPGHMFGAGARRPASTEIVRRFLHRQIPVYVDGAVNIVDVADVASGHLLADELGRVGERYILGNRNFTLDRLFADLGRLSGVEPPPLKLPRVAALALAEAIARVTPDPPVTPLEVRAAAQWWAYRSTKAKRELGYAPGPHEDALRSTIAWHREIDERRCAPPGTRQPLPLRLLGTAARQVDSAVKLLR